MSNKNKIKFFKGIKNILEKSDETENLEENILENIKKDITKIFSSSHLSFLLGAGCSTKAIPTMQEMWEKLFDNEDNQPLKDLPEIQKFNKTTKNLEKLLEVLLAKQFYLEKTSQDKTAIDEAIKYIKKHIFKYVSLTEELEKTEELYKSFYKKLMYRENLLSKVNIFTTNYDLFNEKAMDELGIIYCNGFSGNINRYFNPMTFNYAYAEQIGLRDKKYNVLDRYVYLYKLHGSINWIEEDNAKQLFKIKEIQKPTFQKKEEGKNIMIYPTPTKQSSSFASPYSDLFREFQKKLLQEDNILVVIGYSFADEHINNIIYQALATIPKFRLIIFSHDEIKNDSESEIEKLKNYDDPRIWIIQGTDAKNEHVASFEYIIKNFLLDENKDDEKIEGILKKYIQKEITKK